jgi:hypothetical protein
LGDGERALDAHCMMNSGDVRGASRAWSTGVARHDLLRLMAVQRRRRGVWCGVLRLDSWDLGSVLGSVRLAARVMAPFEAVQGCAVRVIQVSGVEFSVA